MPEIPAEAIQAMWERFKNLPLPETWCGIPVAKNPKQEPPMNNTEEFKDKSCKTKSAEMVTKDCDADADEPVIVTKDAAKQKKQKPALA